jgi:hypothetical protein
MCWKRSSGVRSSVGSCGRMGHLRGSCPSVLRLATGTLAGGDRSLYLLLTRRGPEMTKNVNSNGKGRSRGRMGIMFVSCPSGAENRCAGGK